MAVGLSAGVIALIIGSAASTAASAGLTVAAARASAKSQQNLAEFQAEQDEQRARIARDAAYAAAEDQAEQDRRILAANRARQGAGGLEPTYGAPLLAEIEGAKAAATNEARLRYAGETQSEFYKEQSILDRFAGDINARQTRREGYLAAGTTLLSAARTGYVQANRTGSNAWV